MTSGAGKSGYLKKDGVSSPLFNAVIVCLFAVGLASLPLDFLTRRFAADEMSAKLTATLISRVILSVAAAVFVFKYGFGEVFKGKPTLKSLLILSPCLLVAVNNFPLVGLFTGEVTVTEPAGTVVIYVFSCVFIGVFEEFAFRGIVTPLCLRVTANKKNGVFWGIALSSALFSLSHAFGFFGGNIGGTFMQLGYTFLIGGMCAISLIEGKNIFIPAFLHAVYDVGGLMTANVAAGEQWDTITMLITAILGVIVFAYMSALCLRYDSSSVNRLIKPDEIEDSTQEKND